MTKNRLSKKIILTGAPGSGKTSVLNLLSQNGFSTVAEPARAIIAEQRKIHGSGVYDRDPTLFKELMLSRMIYQYQFMSETNEIVFFDRGIPDIITYSDCFGIDRGSELKAADIFRYHDTVFFLPPWKKIYVNDEDRQISFNEAERFSNNLLAIYAALNYEIIKVPFASLEERSEFIIGILAI